MGLRIRGTLGDIDPLFKKARSRVKKGPLLRSLPTATLNCRTHPVAAAGSAGRSGAAAGRECKPRLSSQVSQRVLGTVMEHIYFPKT